MIDQRTMAAAARLASAEANYSRSIPHRRDRTEPAPVTASGPAVPTQTELEAEYQRDTKLQHEFGDMSAYCAYRRAEARGAFRLHRRVA